MIQQEGALEAYMKSAIKSLPSRYEPSAIPAKPKERLTGDSNVKPASKKKEPGRC